MLHGKRIVCVIPARLGSTRFPKKVLALVHKKPLLAWVIEAARKVPFFDEVVCAVDAPEVAGCAESCGVKSFFTSIDCQSGTDRLIELQQKGSIQADIWVNWQADEPFIHKEIIEDLLQTCMHPRESIWTLKKRITHPEELESPHVVKVVCDSQNKALYFSRCPIPYVRTQGHAVHYKHIGLYAYSAQALSSISRLHPCALEQIEGLEQLRFLYHGLHMHVHDTQYETLGIDLPEHLALASARLLT